MANSHCPQVIGVASGKGGVGKTTVAVNLAVALSMAGKRVALLDADMGLANAQIALGSRSPFNVSHLLSGEKTLREIMVKTEDGVHLVPGASGRRDMAGISEAQVASIIHAFDEVADEFDFVIVDVAAGISPSVMSFLAACHRRYVVLRDEPSSIADAYGTIKVMTSELGLDEVYLIPNMMNSQASGWQLFKRMNEVCTRFLGRSVNYLTSVEADDLIFAALRKYKPVLSFAQGSSGARDFRRMAELSIELPPVTQAHGHAQFFFQRLLDAEQGA
jgi:flagellar biosynthesis protein FlhG